MHESERSKHNTYSSSQHDGHTNGEFQFESRLEFVDVGFCRELRLHIRLQSIDYCSGAVFRNID